MKYFKVVFRLFPQVRVVVGGVGGGVLEVNFPKITESTILVIETLKNSIYRC